MPRYTINVASKCGSADTLDEALSVFGGMMYIDKRQVSKDLLEKGESHQVYGFCTGSVYDTTFNKQA